MVAKGLAKASLFCASLSLLMLAFTACTTGLSNAPSDSAYARHAIAPELRPLYDMLGGETVLGLVISPPMYQGNIVKQYCENALLVYDPYAAAADQRSNLAPLGREWGYFEPPIEAPVQGGSVTVNGYQVYSAFEELYEQLGGVRYAGAPLTNLQYNADKKRLEQHFENVGMALSLEVGDGQAKLLPYGTKLCGEWCSNTEIKGNEFVDDSSLPEPFASTVNRLSLEFVGKYLAGPYVAPDGYTEVIFENLVLYAHPEDRSRSYVRPILGLIGYPESPLVTPFPSPLLVFMPVKGELGHNIPLLFYDYVGLHGSWDVFGEPITEIFEYSAGVYRQCFQKMCLENDTTIAPDHVKPVNMGAVYMNSYYLPHQNELMPPAPSGEEFKIIVNEAQTLLPVTEAQTIYVSVFIDQSPVTGVQPTIQLILPDGSVNVYRLAPTDANGQSVITVPPVVNAQEGSLVLYEACLEDPSFGRQCEEEYYTIWSSQ